MCHLKPLNLHVFFYICNLQYFHTTVIWQCRTGEKNEAFIWYAGDKNRWDDLGCEYLQCISRLWQISVICVRRLLQVCQEGTLWTLSFLWSIQISISAECKWALMMTLEAGEGLSAHNKSAAATITYIFSDVNLVF